MYSVIFDCERMKYPDTGIYSYCLHLGIHLQNELKDLVRFYLPSNAKITDNPRILPQRKLHKLMFPPLGDCTIWHATYQHTDYLPGAHRPVKVLLTVHDLNFIYDDNISCEKKRKYVHTLQQRVNRANAIVCVSESAKNDLLSFCDLKGKPVHVIHNGTNTLSEPLLDSGSVKPKRPFLFSIGTIRRKKNFHSLIPLIRTNPSLDLVIAGKPEDKGYRNYIERMAVSEGVSENLHLVGQITEREKSWYYHNCRAFVFPSVAEGFGLPAVEAMSVGKPVFLAERTSLPEIGSTAAFYFSDFTVEKMHASFVGGMQLFEKENRSDMLKKRAEIFCWQKSAREYMKIYESLSNVPG